jgi:transcriptional regulator with XRE-family HTH domain
MRINAFNIYHFIVYNQNCSSYNVLMLFEIGNQIRLARKVRKLTQADLASALGMSRTTIGQIENGTVQDIGIRKVIRLLEFLELELRVRPSGKPPTLEELQEEEEG